MLIPFHTLTNRARVWIFSSEKNLNNIQLQGIRESLKNFTSGWQSHNKDVFASFEIWENQFIILAAEGDLSDISGCGIDKLMHLISSLEQNLNISLTNKTLLHFKFLTGIQTISISEFKTTIADGLINEDVLYYNTTITTLGELRTSFCVPIRESWLNKYFPAMKN